MCRWPRLNGSPTITCQRVGISSVRSTAPREVLVRDVPSAEEPAESAAKERQCVRYHRSKKREESTKQYQSNSQERAAWSGSKTEEDPMTPAGQVGRILAGLKEHRRAPSP